VKHVQVRVSAVSRPGHPYFVAYVHESGRDHNARWGTTHELAAEAAFALHGEMPVFYHCNYDGRLP
jgi:hypothetical protein